MPTKPKRPSIKKKGKLVRKPGWRSLMPMLAILVGAFVIMGAFFVPKSHAAETQLDAQQIMYPRAIRLAASGAANGRLIATGSAPSQDPGTDGVTDMAKIYESTDNGASFHQVGQIKDPEAANSKGAGMGSVFELPTAMGAQPAGTLLYGTTVGMVNKPGRVPAIRVWKSDDHGYTWSYLSSCATTQNAPIPPAADRGLWEPEFSVDARGSLNCFYSDDTRLGANASFDQTLAMVSSTDGGVTWSTPKNVVALADSGTTTTRPGMAVVRKLPNGTYMMSYEVCGARPDSCLVHYRTSADGWNWGNPADLGPVAQTPDGKRLFHAPTIAWAPGGGPNGRVLMISVLTKDATGKILSPASGSTIFANTENGAGKWYELTSPVKVAFSAAPDGNELVCSNYSSSLLPSADGKAALEVATKRLSDGTCKAFFASGSIMGTGTATGITSGKVYRLLNVKSGQCLDDPKGLSTSQALQQWTCNALAPQNWTVTKNASGYYTLKNKQSAKCLYVKGATTAAGAAIWQATCSTSTSEQWSLKQVGNGYYNLVGRYSGKCVEVKGGSTATQAAIVQNTCTKTTGQQTWQLQLQ